MIVKQEYVPYQAFRTQDGYIVVSCSPIRLSETPTRLYKAPPLLGEDNDALL